MPSTGQPLRFRLDAFDAGLVFHVYPAPPNQPQTASFSSFDLNSSLNKVFLKQNAMQDYLLRTHNSFKASFHACARCQYSSVPCFNAKKLSRQFAVPSVRHPSSSPVRALIAKVTSHFVHEGIFINKQSLHMNLLWLGHIMPK